MDLLGSASLVPAAQVVNVDDEAEFVLTDHVPHFTLIDPLILLQNSR